MALTCPGGTHRLYFPGRAEAQMSRADAVQPVYSSASQLRHSFPQVRPHLFPLCSCWGNSKCPNVGKTEIKINVPFIGKKNLLPPQMNLLYVPIKQACIGHVLDPTRTKGNLRTWGPPLSGCLPTSVCLGSCAQSQASSGVPISGTHVAHPACHKSSVGNPKCEPTSPGSQ